MSAMLYLNFHPFPVLTTERLTLRPVTHEDNEEVFFLRSDREVMKYLGQPLAASTQEIIAYIDNLIDKTNTNEGIAWAITIRNDTKLIGIIAFRKFQKEHYRGELGYGLHPDWQNKGIMHEAMGAVLDYGFTTIRLHSVEANVDKENIASIRLLEKNNFTKEAHFKENYYFEGRFIDSVIYSLINPRDIGPL